jgi:hypothetical protein
MQEHPFNSLPVLRTQRHFSVCDEIKKSKQYIWEIPKQYGGRNFGILSP